MDFPQGANDILSICIIQAVNSHKLKAFRWIFSEEIDKLMEETKCNKNWKLYLILIVFIKNLS